LFQTCLIFLGAQTVITDVTEANERLDNLGKLHFSYGIGTFFGVVASNLCAKYTMHRFAAYVAAAGSLLSLFLVFCFVPDHTKVNFYSTCIKYKCAAYFETLFTRLWRVSLFNPVCQILHSVVIANVLNGFNL